MLSVDLLGMEYSDLLDYLYGLRRFGTTPTIKNITKVMESFGNPQHKLRVIHVSGTNGKGSVCAMLSSILEKAGYRTGLYTSPHLIDFRERIQINRQQISEEDVLRLSEKVIQKIEETATPLTFFEFTTALMFLYFAEQGIDYAVIEVGMGARFDATNIVRPVITVITNISLEHTKVLGDTAEAIATEKSQIIKCGAPIFTTSEIEVIRKTAEERRTRYFLVAEKEGTNLRGEFQKANAGIATAVARYLGVTDSIIREGLSSVSWPGRLQYMDRNFLLDCAHNPAGIKEMAKFVKTLHYKRLIVVFGVMQDKNYTEMLNSLPRSDLLIATKPRINRALEPETIKQMAGEKCKVVPDVSDALDYAKSVGEKDDLVLVCGSCYLAGEVLAIRNKIKITPIMFVQ